MTPCAACLSLPSLGAWGAAMSGPKRNKKRSEAERSGAPYLLAKEPLHRLQRPTKLQTTPQVGRKGKPHTPKVNTSKSADAGTDLLLWPSTPGGRTNDNREQPPSSAGVAELALLPRGLRGTLSNALPLGHEKPTTCRIWPQGIPKPRILVPPLLAESLLPDSPAAPGGETPYRETTCGSIRAELGPTAQHGPNGALLRAPSNPAEAIKKPRLAGRARLKPKPQPGET